MAMGEKKVQFLPPEFMASSFSNTGQGKRVTRTQSEDSNVKLPQAPLSDGLAGCRTERLELVGRSTCEHHNQLWPEDRGSWWAGSCGIGKEKCSFHLEWNSLFSGRCPESTPSPQDLFSLLPSRLGCWLHCSWECGQGFRTRCSWVLALGVHSGMDG